MEYVQDVQTNLLSVSKAERKKQFQSHLREKGMSPKYNGNIILEGKLKYNLYEVQLTNKYKTADQAKVLYSCNDKNCMEI